MQQPDRPVYDTSAVYFKERDTGGRPFIGPRYAAGIKEPNAGDSLIPWDMRVPMKQQIAIVWRKTGRNVLQATAQSISLQVYCNRPVCIAVAISPNERDWRTNCPQLIQNVLGTNVAQMPNLLSGACEVGNGCR